MTVEIAPVPIEKEKMLAFAKEYDPIPLHTDEDYAAQTLFGKSIAPGVMSFMSVWAKYLEVDFLGDELLAANQQRLNGSNPFLQMTFLPASPLSQIYRSAMQRMVSLKFLLMYSTKTENLY